MSVIQDILKDPGHSKKAIVGKTLEEAEKIDATDIMDLLGGIPAQKLHCACLSKRTLRKAINAYKNRVIS